MLLTNDDGWDAPGITVMYDALVAAGYSVTLVGPKVNNSGASMATRPGALASWESPTDSHKWWVDGTPVDSVRVGLTGILSSAPDIVISGTNHGANAAYGLNYSGTVGAATAAAEQGIPAIAVSADVGADDAQTNFSGAAKTILRLLSQLDTASLAAMRSGDIINVNVPVGVSQGDRVATQAATEFVSGDYNRDPQGKWVSTNVPSAPAAANSDKALLAAGFTTLTVLAVARDGSEQSHPALDSLLAAFTK